MLAGGCVAALGGVDALVFTGGIGENAVDLRRQLCDCLSWLGIDLEEAVRVEMRADRWRRR